MNAGSKVMEFAKLEANGTKRMEFAKWSAAVGMKVFGMERTERESDSRTEVNVSKK